MHRRQGLTARGRILPHRFRPSSRCEEEGGGGGGGDGDEDGGEDGDDGDEDDGGEDGEDGEDGGGGGGGDDIRDVEMREGVALSIEMGVSTGGCE